MSLNNLTAELTESGEIIIRDDKTYDIIYHIPAPIMWDAKFETSNDVSMALIDHQNGKYTLTVVADPSWINAEDRAFPVTIDPPLYDSTSHSASNVIDLSFQTNGSSNTVSDQKLYIKPSSAFIIFIKYVY